MGETPSHESSPGPGSLSAVLGAVNHLRWDGKWRERGIENEERWTVMEKKEKYVQVNEEKGWRDWKRSHRQKERMRWGSEKERSDSLLKNEVYETGECLASFRFFPIHSHLFFFSLSLLFSCFKTKRFVKRETDIFIPHFVSIIALMMLCLKERKTRMYLEGQFVSFLFSTPCLFSLKKHSSPTQQLKQLFLFSFLIPQKAT